MENLANQLKSIESSLKESLKIFESSKEFFSEMKRISSSNEEYDFHEFEDLNVFEKFADENILENDDKKVESRLELNKIDMILTKELKKLDSKRSSMYEQYKSQMQDMSKEIRAVHSVLKFVNHWNKQIENDFKLREYPEMFLTCFNKIPANIRRNIGVILSRFKHVKNLSNDLSGTQNILSECNRINQSDLSSKSSDVAVNQYLQASSIRPEKLDSSYDSMFLPADLKNKVEKKNVNYKRGNTDANISLLDYTYYPSKMRVLASSDMSLVNRTLELKSPGNDKVYHINENDDELNESALSNDPLNQAVHEIDDDYKRELPSFLNDSSRIPEIEKVTTGDESYSKLYVSRVIDMSVMNRSVQDASTAMYNDDSICADVRMESIYRQRQEIEESIRNIDFNKYDFNNSSLPPLDIDQESSD